MNPQDRFRDKSFLITGGAGSLGRALTSELLKTGAARIALLDINQHGLEEMEKKISDGRMRYFLGDVRDLSRLKRAVEECNYIIHCAAYKIIPSLEYSPFEAVATNILGTQNLIEAVLDDGEVEEVCAISSDKSCEALNLYGSSKKVMEHLITASNFYKGKRKTRLFSCRYGNVWASESSVIKVWMEEAKGGTMLHSGYITVTKPSMTRFSINMSQAIEFVFRNLELAKGGEVFVPKGLKAYSVQDLAEAFIQFIGRPLEIHSIGVRPGEKDHETLISKHEMPETIDNGVDYVILPSEWLRRKFRLRYYFDDVNTPDISEYESSTAPRLTVEELKHMIKGEIE